MTNQIILGFDVGTHKFGVAVGQTLLGSAKPLERIKANKGTIPAEAFTKLLKEWRPHQIVVGVPLHMDGSPQFITQIALNFIAFLKTLTNIPIFEVDERLTTKTARQDVFEQGGLKQLRKTDIDSYAAKLIVESWMAYLERQTN